MTEYTETLGLTKPDFNAVGWDDALNANFDAIDAAIAQSIFFQGFRGQWLNNTLYAVDDIAIDAATDETYKCLIAHTSPNSPTTFAQARVANPSRWQLVDTAAASAAAAQVHKEAAQDAATTATTQAGLAGTYANTAYASAQTAVAASSAAYASASASSSSAQLAAAAVYNLRAIATIVPEALLTKDYSVVCPAGYIPKITVFTKVAFTGATVDLSVGTTNGGDELVAATDVKAQGIYNLTLKASAAPLIAPFGGGMLYIRLAQTTPTTTGNAKVVIEFLPAEP